MSAVQRTSLVAQHRLRCTERPPLLQAAAGCTGWIEAGEIHGEAHHFLDGDPAPSALLTCRRCLDYDADEALAEHVAAGAPGYGSHRERSERKARARMEFLSSRLEARGWTWDARRGVWRSPDGRTALEVHP